MNVSPGIENQFVELKASFNEEVIADVFKDMEWIEKVNTGYKRVLDYFKVENLKLQKFETQSGGTLITVFSAFEVDENSRIEK
jgi:predicted HTH transcriptional regulator